MADLVRDGESQVWIKVRLCEDSRRHNNTDCIQEGTLIRQPRAIESISGNVLTLSVPLTDAIEKKYSTGSVRAYTAKGSNNAGIENVTISVTPSCSGAPITDPACGAFSAVTFQPFAVDSWALNLTLTGFVAGFVSVLENAQRITIENVVSVRDQVSDGSSGWGADISIDGTQVLVKDCDSQGRVAGARSFSIALGGGTAGPNAVLNQKATLASQVIQPHMRWAHGLLVENSQAPVEFINRGTAGTGHGWTISAGVAWNSDAAWNIQSPPLGVNWAIGMRGARNANTNGTEIATGEVVTPKSLYAAQLKVRRAAA